MPNLSFIILKLGILLKIISNYFVNPLSSIIATLLAFIYFLIICIPFYSTIFPLISYFKIQNILYIPNDIFSITLYFMFALTIIYLFLDILFGFTIKDFIKDKIDISNSKELEVFYTLFEEVIERFDIRNVEFLLDENEAINAYAVATFRKKYVIVTTGILSHITNSFDSYEEKEKCFKGLIGHELSHLINWDFLPKLILLSGQKVSQLINTLFEIIFNVLLSISNNIPIIGVFTSTILSLTYSILQFCFNFLYNFIITPIYLLIERFLGRLIEYRSDYQSAEAVGWESVYLSLYTLLSLNGNTYHSKFSTHPNTVSRILNIYKIPDNNNKITASSFSKYFGLFLIAFISLLISFIFLYEHNLISSYSFYQFHYSLMELYNQTIRFVYQIQNLLTEIFNFIKFKLELYNINSYVGIGIIFILLIFIIISIKFYITSIQLKKISLANLNTDETTPIDILLFYSIQNNDLSSFCKLIHYGANINSTLNGNTLHHFILNNNPKFLKIYYLLNNK